MISIFRHARLFAFLACFTVLFAGSTALAAGNVGEEAADFPPGVFSDGGRYSLEDFEGKVVVLFFYESKCPGCRKKIPERNAVVKAFKDKPVKFLAIAPEDTFAETSSYVRQTRLAMPAFADTLGLMQARYGLSISLQNIYQFRVIGPDGKIAEYNMTEDAIEKVIGDAKWKYKDDGYDKRLAKAIDLLEWNQYEAGMKALRPQLKNKATAESAQKLYDKVKEEAEQWSEDAAAAEDAEPVKAYDLYARVAACFPNEEMGKTAKEAAAKLKKNKEVADELAARKMFNELYRVLTKATPTQRPAVAKFCHSIVKKYGDTPTGQRAAALAEELGEPVQSADAR